MKLFWKIMRSLVYLYYTQPFYWTSTFGQNHAYCIRIFTVHKWLFVNQCTDTKQYSSLLMVFLMLRRLVFWPVFPFASFVHLFTNHRSNHGQISIWFQVWTVPHIQTSYVNNTYVHHVSIKMCQFIIYYNSLVSWLISTTCIFVLLKTWMNTVTVFYKQWLVRWTCDLRVTGSSPDHDTAWLFLR